MDRLKDEEVEIWLGNLLRTGVLIAGAIVLLGGMMFLIQHGAESPSYRRFVGEPAEFRKLTGIARAAASLSGPGIIQLGLVLLIATPIARVALSAYAFARERDIQYVVITLVVLALLAYSLFA